MTQNNTDTFQAACKRYALPSVPFVCSSVPYRQSTPTALLYLLTL